MNIVFSCGEGFFLLFSVTFVSDVCLSIYYTCFLLCLLLVCWSVRISVAGWVIYFLCGTPMCGVPGRYSLFKCFLGADGGTVQIFFLFHSSVVAGTVRLKW